MFVTKGLSLEVLNVNLKYVAIASILLSCAPLATGDDTGSVSIVGKNVDSSDPGTA